MFGDGILAHNGTLFNETLTGRFADQQDGQTDSERILLYLIDTVNAEQDRLGRALTADERFALLEQLTLRLSAGNKLNLLVWDGTYLYAHSNYAGTLHYCHPTPDSVLLSTHPLDSVAPGEWQPLPFLRLVVYRDGQEVYTGIPLSQEYFDPEENFEYKELDYANL